jgi:hypothetical protein
MGLFGALLDLPRTAVRLGAQAASGPLVAALDEALAQLVAEVIDARALVRATELDALVHRAGTLKDEVAAAGAELAGVDQAARAQDADLGEALGVGDVPSAVARLEAHRGDLARRADRMMGALDVVAGQIEALAGRLATLARPH